MPSESVDVDPRTAPRERPPPDPSLLRILGTSALRSVALGTIFASVLYLFARGPNAWQAFPLGMLGGAIFIFPASAVELWLSRRRPSTRLIAVGAVVLLVVFGVSVMLALTQIVYAEGILRTGYIEEGMGNVTRFFRRVGQRPGAFLFACCYAGLPFAIVSVVRLTREAPIRVLVMSVGLGFGPAVVFTALSGPTSRYEEAGAVFMVQMLLVGFVPTLWAILDKAGDGIAAALSGDSQNT